MNTSLALKVCGLTQLSQIEQLISMKIDFLGFIFYEKSPRYVRNHLSLEQIATIPHQGKVGVFVNESLENILEITQKAQLNFIQLHGDENENFIDKLKTQLHENIKIIKVLRINQFSQTKIDAQLSTLADYFLFDTDSHAFGGTGKTFDWNILNLMDISRPYFLSGGISLENYQNIHQLKTRPFALDINSKFEISAGIKDLDKIQQLKTSLN